MWRGDDLIVTLKRTGIAEQPQIARRANTAQKSGEMERTAQNGSNHGEIWTTAI